MPTRVFKRARPATYLSPSLEVPGPMSVAVLGDGIPDSREEIPKILAAIRTRVGRKDVLLIPDPATDESTPPRQPQKVFVYADRAKSRVIEGTPLLVTARCDDPESWPQTVRAFRAEGFEPCGEPSIVGPTKGQCFISRTRASFVAPQHSDATMAVERTGRSALGWIVPTDPDKPVAKHRPTKFPRDRGR